MPHSRIVTYSPAYTLVPTYECFNRCSYCSFRVEMGEGGWLDLATAAERLRSLGQGQGRALLGEDSIENSVCEILILSGEVHPRSERRAQWLERIEAIARLALDLGFLPHTNVGPLQFSEMERLREVNVSMGLMLEQLTPRLLQTVHRHAPSKVPELRLQQLHWAGKLGIPFTTGILVGVGETMAERQKSLEAIANIHRRYGHIQEVILQPYRRGRGEDGGRRREDGGQTAGWRDAERMAWRPEDEATGELGYEGWLELIRVARTILPEEVEIQIPPNLVEKPELIVACVEAGVRDLGGIGPLDEVNPDYAQPRISQLRATLAQGGWSLQPRLPVYPHLLHRLSPNLQAACQGWRDRYGLDD